MQRSNKTFCLKNKSTDISNLVDKQQTKAKATFSYTAER